MKYDDNGEYKDIYVKSFDTLPVGTEVDFDGNEVPSGWSEVTSEDFKSKVTFNETIGSYNMFKKIGNLVIICFQGENKTHSANDVLFTLPTGYRPSSYVMTAFSSYASAYGQLIIDTNGSAYVGSISSNSSGRICFSIAFTID